MLRLYMDVHVKAAITAGLRRRGIDVVTAQEDGGARIVKNLKRRVVYYHGMSTSLR
jgi:hypothetical protein